MAKSDNPFATVSVVAPSSGLITRTPTDQAGKTTGNRCITAASNVRCDQGVLRNAPGYESLATNITLDSAPNLIFQANLNPSNSGVVDDTLWICTANSIYSGVKQFTIPTVTTVVPPPALNTCGVQSNWNALPSALPYLNSGNNVTGFVNQYGVVLVSMAGFIAGSVPGTSAPFYSLTNLPVTAGDFIMQATFSANMPAGFYYVDSANQLALVFNWYADASGTGHAQVMAYCALNTFPSGTQTQLVSSTGFAAGATSTPYIWKVQKSGSLFLIYINGVQVLSYDAQSANIVGTLGLWMNIAANSTGTVSNISIQA